MMFHNTFAILVYNNFICKIHNILILYLNLKKNTSLSIQLHVRIYSIVASKIIQSGCDLDQKLSNFGIISLVIFFNRKGERLT